MTPPPQDLRDAWARVFAHAWHHNPNDFLRKLNKDPKATIEGVVSSGEPKSLVDSCTTILRYVNDENSEEGFLALPPIQDSFRQGLNEEQLYQYASQDGLYGTLRVC
jgi:hypothetical protein